MARVVIENLSKTFAGRERKRVCAVANLTLAVESGELLVLVGPSGCGKTTTLRLIAGLDQPDSGTLAIDGQVVNQLSPKKRDVAMVFQTPALFPHLTVYQNLALGLALRDCPKAELQQRVNDAAEMLGLTGCLDRLPMALSGGERQRVALGRALVRRPKVFLLDEPLSNLDPQTRARLRLEIIRLHRLTKATLIYVTHDQGEALALGQRVAVLRHGRLEQLAEPMALYDRPANLFVAGFIGSPQMNFIRGTFEERGSEIWFRGETSSNTSPDWPSEPLEFEAPSPSPPLAEGVGQRKPELHEATQPRTPGFALAVPLPERQQVGGHVGKKVLLGLRPEQVSPQIGPAAHGCMVEARIDRIEPSGPEAWLHVTAAGYSLAVRVGRDFSVRTGEAMSLRVNMRQAHFFDAETGKAIG